MHTFDSQTFKVSQYSLVLFIGVDAEAGDGGVRAVTETQQVGRGQTRPHVNVQDIVPLIDQSLD